MPNLFSCCNRISLSPLCTRCCPLSLEAGTGQRQPPSVPKTYRSQRFPPVKSCALIHSAIFGKAAGGGRTCRSNPFSSQGGSHPESTRRRGSSSIGAVLDLKTFHEFGI